nr:TlpA disulfide reductase family protein [Polaribacter porphyrae]
MKKFLLVLLFNVVLISCDKQKAKDDNINKEENKISVVKSYTYNQLKTFLNKNNNKTYVVNFWATWCAPCVKELPYFERIKKEYEDKNVEVLLVSLDFPKQVEKKLIPFINKRKLQSEVVLLDDVNENFWIKDIDSTWSGALPATLIYNKNNRKFYEKSFTYQSLENELKTILNP